MWSLVVAVFTSAGTTALAMGQATNPPAELAQVESLKAKAFEAARTGQFEVTSQLLTQAIELQSDPALETMSRWLEEHRVRQEKVGQQRSNEFEKSVSQIKLVKEAGHDAYAIDFLAAASLYATDRDAFAKEPWVREMIAEATAMAQAAEDAEQWLTARRIYGDLSAIEPTQPLWRTRLNDVSRRLRLLAVYAPKILDEMYDKETDVIEAVRLIADPERNPTPRAVRNEEMDESFKVDWRKTLEGVNAFMLRDAMEDARQAYWRTSDPTDMLTGAMQAIRAVVSTRGLETSFPQLQDEARVAEFRAALDELQNAIQQLSDRRKLDASITAVLEANRLTINLPPELMIAEFADGALSRLDPFSNVIWPYDLADFQKSTQGEFIGIGVQISQDDEGWLKVVTPFEGTPAYRAGVKPGDLITHINGKFARGVNTSQAVNHITGPRGTSVLLTIRSPEGESRDILIKRDLIKVPSVRGWSHQPGGGWDYYIDPESQIAYLRLTSFTKDTGEELNQSVARLASSNVKGIILDLRHNPGGVFQAATAVVDKFLSDGVIVSRRGERDLNPPPAVTAVPHRDDLPNIPLVVLVNQYSASASEIVAGALKDHRRALIVGERTFGKGSVQELFPLADRTAYLKLTTSHYYLPSGRCIHREEDSTVWGVEPDLIINMTPEQMREANRVRQSLDVLHDSAQEGETAVKEQDQLENQLLETDPQLSTALLMLRMRLAGAGVM